MKNSLSKAGRLPGKVIRKSTINDTIKPVLSKSNSQDSSAGFTVIYLVASSMNFPGNLSSFEFATTRARRAYNQRSSETFEQHLFPCYFLKILIFSMIESEKYHIPFQNGPGGIRLNGGYPDLSSF